MLPARRRGRYGLVRGDQDVTATDAGRSPGPGRAPGPTARSRPDQGRRRRLERTAPITPPSARGRVASDLAVDQMEIGAPRDRASQVVGDQHDGLPPAVEVHEQRPRRAPRRVVSSAPVGSSATARRAVHHGAGHRDTLPFAAAELPGRLPRRVCIPSTPISSPARAARPRSCRASRAATGCCRHGEVVEQVEELEDQPDVGAPDPRRAGLAQKVDPAAAPRPRLVGRSRAADQVEQRGLSAAGGPRRGDGPPSMSRSICRARAARRRRSRLVTPRRWMSDTMGVLLGLRPFPLRLRGPRVGRHRQPGWNGRSGWMRPAASPPFG